MEAVNGVSEADKGGPPAPSPLTGCYLLVVVGEPHSKEHKDIILRRIAKGLLSWDLGDCHVDLEKELAIITEQAPEGEDARYGERLIQFASENLVTEILIHPAISTLSQCMKNLLSSFTRHRHIIHAGYTFAANGSWILQDGTFSLTDFSEAFQEIDVQRVLRAYDSSITLDIHCSPEGDWTRLPKESFTKNCKVRVNPDDVLTSGSPSIVNFLNYISPLLIPTDIEMLLESSDVVGNIRFSHPTLYVFPGGQGDAALFGINGFNMLVDGGFARKACFWDFVRHLDRLDAVLLTRLNNSNVNGISSVLRRKRFNTVYPQIGHFFCNIQERKAILSPDGDKDKDPLIVNLLEEGQEIVSNLRQLHLQPQTCYRDVEPINLYHKVGHGTLDMYVLSPTKESKEVREFIQKWNTNDQRLFANQRNGKDFTFPTQNLVSICALLVWQPANANDSITRILFPGSTPQHKVFEGLDRLKQLECIKYPSCSAKTLTPSLVKSKQAKVEKLLQQEQRDYKTKEKLVQQVEAKTKIENKIAEENIKNIQTNGVTTDQVIAEKIKIKKHDSTESEKSGPQSTELKKSEDAKEPTQLTNGKPTEEKTVEKPKLKAKPDQKPKVEAKVYKHTRSIDRKPKAAVEKKASPTTPKKTLDSKVNGDAPARPRTAIKVSPSATPAKSAKEANNRKVVESKYKVAAKKEVSKPEKKDTKPERKPISRRPKETSPIAKLPESPIKKLSELPKVEARKSKLEKEGTTDSSTVSTPSADAETALKKDISKLTPEELEQFKARELAELKEEQEVVKEIEAVFRKSEKKVTGDSDLRKVKNISVDEKTEGEGEEYLIIEKEEVEHDSLDEKEVKESETQKHLRDSEESEKQRKLSDAVVVETEDIKEEQSAVPPSTEPAKDIDSQVITSIADATNIKEDKEQPKEVSKEMSVTSPDDKVDISSGKKPTDRDADEENKDGNILESQPDEKFSTPIESGATTAPTLPEDERIPLDEIKEDNADQVIEEKYVKEDTKEKEIPVVQLPPKTTDSIAKLPTVVGIRLDKQTPIRDLVKTPDEVADLPVHEEVDIANYEHYQATQSQTPKQEDAKQPSTDKEVAKLDEAVKESPPKSDEKPTVVSEKKIEIPEKVDETKKHEAMEEKVTSVKPVEAIKTHEIKETLIKVNEVTIQEVEAPHVEEKPDDKVTEEKSPKTENVAVPQVTDITKDAITRMEEKKLVENEAMADPESTTIELGETKPHQPAEAETMEKKILEKIELTDIDKAEDDKVDIGKIEQAKVDIVINGEEEKGDTGKIDIEEVKEEKVDEEELKEKVDSGKVEDQKVDIEKTQEKPEKLEKDKVDQEKVKVKIEVTKVEEENLDINKTEKEKIDAEKITEEDEDVKIVEEEKADAGKITEEKIELDIVKDEKEDIAKLEEKTVNAEKEKVDIKTLEEVKKVDTEKVKEEKVDVEHVEDEKVNIGKIHEEKANLEEVKEEKLEVGTTEKDTVDTEKKTIEEAKVIIQSEEPTEKVDTKIELTEKEREMETKPEKPIEKVDIGKVEEESLNAKDVVLVETVPIFENENERRAELEQRTTNVGIPKLNVENAEENTEQEKSPKDIAAKEFPEKIKIDKVEDQQHEDIEDVSKADIKEETAKPSEVQQSKSQQKDDVEESIVAIEKELVAVISDEIMEIEIATKKTNEKSDTIHKIEDVKKVDAEKQIDKKEKERVITEEKLHDVKVDEVVKTAPEEAHDNKVKPSEVKDIEVTLRSEIEDQVRDHPEKIDLKLQDDRIKEISEIHLQKEADDFKDTKTKETTVEVKLQDVIMAEQKTEIAEEKVVDIKKTDLKESIAKEIKEEDEEETSRDKPAKAEKVDCTEKIISEDLKDSHKETNIDNDIIEKIVEKSTEEPVECKDQNNESRPDDIIEDVNKDLQKVEIETQVGDVKELMNEEIAKLQKTEEVKDTKKQEITDTFKETLDQKSIEKLETDKAQSDIRVMNVEKSEKDIVKTSVVDLHPDIKESENINAHPEKLNALDDEIIEKKELPLKMEVKPITSEAKAEELITKDAEYTDETVLKDIIDLKKETKHEDKETKSGIVEKIEKEKSVVEQKEEDTGKLEKLLGSTKDQLVFDKEIDETKTKSKDIESDDEKVGKDTHMVLDKTTDQKEQTLEDSVIILEEKKMLIDHKSESIPQSTSAKTDQLEEKKDESKEERLIKEQDKSMLDVKSIASDKPIQIEVIAENLPIQESKIDLAKAENEIETVEDVKAEEEPNDELSAIEKLLAKVEEVSLLITEEVTEAAVKPGQDATAIKLEPSDSQTIPSPQKLEPEKVSADVSELAKRDESAKLDKEVLNGVESDEVKKDDDKVFESEVTKPQPNEKPSEVIDAALLLQSLESDEKTVNQGEKDYSDETGEKTAVQSFRDDSLEISKIDKKLQELKEAADSDITQDDTKAEHKVKSETQSKNEIDVVDKIELGRKSPKEREQDVALIVASVAEVLKSDAPLEEFEGKIPLEISTYTPYAPYSTELRETHITTVDSPILEDLILDKMHPIEEEKSSPRDSLSMFLDEERKIAPVHTNYDILEKSESRASSLIKDSTELIQATSKIISDIKQSSKTDDEIVTEVSKDTNATTAELSVVSAETVLEKSSPAVDEPKKPSPEPVDVKKESVDTKESDIKTDPSISTRKSAPDIKEQVQDALDVHKLPLSSGKSSPDIKELLKDTITIDKYPVLSGKSSPDIKEPLKDTISIDRSPVLSGKSSPDIKEPLKDTISIDRSPVLSGKSSPDIKERLKDTITIDKSPALSGKSSPDIKEPLKDTITIDKSPVLSGKSSPDIKEPLKDTITIDKSPVLSGKSSPDVNESIKHTLDKDNASDVKVGVDTKDAKPCLTSNIEETGITTPVNSTVKDVTKEKLTTDVKTDIQVSSDSPSGKLTPDIKETMVDTLIVEKITPETSGKSTPEIKEPIETQETIGSKVAVLSGKSSPDTKELLVDSVPTAPSEKTTAERKESTTKVDKSLVSSEKISTDIKDSVKDSLDTTPTVSGKTTPEIIEPVKDTIDITLSPMFSGKSTPDIVIDDEIATAIALAIASERSTPDTEIAVDKHVIDLEKDNAMQEAAEAAFVKSETSSVIKQSLDKSTIEMGTSSPEVKDIAEFKKSEEKLVDELGKLVSDNNVYKSSEGSELTTSDKKQTETVSKSSVISGKKIPDTKHSSENGVDFEKSPVASRKESLKEPAKDFCSVSGKSTPEIKESTLTGSGTTTPGRKDSVDLKHITAPVTPDSKSVEIKDYQQEQVRKVESIPGPSSSTKGDSFGRLSLSKSPTEELDYSRKSTPDIADITKGTEIEECRLGRTTPPTVPVSPVVKEKRPSLHDQEKSDKKDAQDVSSIKSMDFRSSTPASDDCDISSGQVSRVLTTEGDDEKQVYSDDDDLPGSPLSATSQVAHSTSSQYDFEDSVRGIAPLDPMSTSFYGALPDDPVDLSKGSKSSRYLDETDLDFDKALLEHRQTRGEDLDPSASPSHIYEITTAKYSSIKLQEEHQLPEADVAGSVTLRKESIMTASFIGSELPTDTKDDPIASWGKPLGLPSPAPLNDNKGTPKKERKIPANVMAKNKLNEDKKLSDSKYDRKGKKINPVYVDLTYVPHHGNSNYSYVEFFKRIRARYYVFSGIEPSKEVYNALLEAKQTWDDKELEVTIIPTYDTDVLGYWVAENEDLLAKYKIDLSPSASRCTINLQDHETSCSAYRLEFS